MLYCGLVADCDSGLLQALKTANSSTQPAPQSLSGASVATGPPMPQHIAVHPYSQPTLPLGPFANMIGYPFLPQSYTYMPSAFQQSFAGNNTYHQSLAALLPQYKSSVSVSSLPQSAAVPSGYGGLGSATSVPGNYPMNPPAAPSGSALNYEDVLSSQYKESSHLLSLQQQVMLLHLFALHLISLPSSFHAIQNYCLVTEDLHNNLWYHLRTRTQQCGFTDKVQERCKLFHPAHIIITRDKISSLVVLGNKVNSSRRITGPLGTLISTILRRESHLISNKTQEMAHLVPLKDSLSSPKSGPMVTNQLVVLQGPRMMSVEVTFQAVMARYDLFKAMGHLCCAHALRSYCVLDVT